MQANCLDESIKPIVSIESKTKMSTQHEIELSIKKLEIEQHCSYQGEALKVPTPF